MKSSEIPGFYKMPLKDRIELIKSFAGLSKEDVKILEHNSSLPHETADMMIENVIGMTHIPIGVATNFRINGTDKVIPMAIEETSVVAAASHAAKLARAGGGFTTSSDEPIMIGQIQLVGVKNIKKAKRDILARFEELRAMANSRDSTLVKLGGGIKGMEVREISTERGPMIIVHLLVDVRDAMGANAVNTYCEAVSPELEKITGGRSLLKIISNLAVKRMVRATAVWRKEVIGADTVEGILDAYAFAKADPYRGATHNKGVMNSVDAVVIATSNDWRAVEAGAHAYASITGKYIPLTRYEKNSRGDLVGHIELPLAVGLVGGATKVHPVSQVMLKILDVSSAKELAEVAASVGLASNFAAMRAMVVEGIRKGHMKLHATNIAHMAGAHGPEIDAVAKIMVEENNISYARAEELTHQVRHDLRKQKIEKMIKKVKKKVRRKKRR